MRDASAPGPDGIPIGFYKVFFPNIKDNLVQMVNSFLVDGWRPDSFRKGRVILIAKPGGEPSQPQGYRPLLCQTPTIR